MAKIIISLLLIASLAGIVADAAATSTPGDALYPFRIYINNNVASALCAMQLPCPPDIEK